MTTVHSLPYFELEIDKLGNLVTPSQIVPRENLFAMAHGWNSDMNDARALYDDFFNQFNRTLEAHGIPEAAKKCAVMGILWPSEKYADPALTPGGAAGMRLRRAATYRLMKHRAGIAGRGALALVLNRIQARIHLVGHSFGARVITAAAAVATRPVASMTLLQAAFSQNAFSPAGAFRNIITGHKCEGPILITHSANDGALGVYYPIASRILRQNASSLLEGYGALGRNGAQRTQEASFGELLPEGAPYSFSPGRIFNLRADAIIQAHADIVKPETAWALIAAAGLGRA